MIAFDTLKKYTPQTGSRHGRALALLMLLCLSAWLSAGETWRISGLGLQVEPARVIAVKDIPLVAGYSLQALDSEGRQPTLPDGWSLRVRYTPPAGSEPVEKTLPLQWEGRVTFDAGPNEGLGSLSGWTVLNDQGQVVRLFSQTIAVEVLGDVIVPQVEIKRLSYEELQELGVVLSDDNMHGLKVELKARVEETTEELDTELVLIRDEVLGTWTPIDKGGRRLAYAPVSIGVKADPIPRLRALTSKDLPLEEDYQQFATPPARREPPKLDAIIVFPANIGYLNSFFKPTLILLNVAPEETNYVVRNLRATINYPEGALRLANLGQTQQQDLSEPLGPGPDGVNGNEDDEPTIRPQQKAYTSWVLEGRKPGEHAISFDIQGTLQAEDGRSYPIYGNASGQIYVRRPNLNLHFNFPSVVREDDDFEIEAVFTLTNDVEVQDLRFDMSGASVLGLNINSTLPYMNGQLVTGPVILSNPGDQVTFLMDCTSLTTGRVAVHGVSSEEDEDSLSVSYAVNVAVGEHGLPVSAVALLLPKSLIDFPDLYGFEPEVLDLVKVVAGRALSLSGIAPGDVQNGLSNVPNTAIRNWVQDLTLAVLKPRSGDVTEIRRLMSRDLFLASLAQDTALTDFFKQDSKFAEWTQLLSSHAGDVSDLPDGELLLDGGMLLFENPNPGEIDGMPFGDPDQGAVWTAVRFEEQFGSAEWAHSGGALRGLFYNGRRWGRFVLDDPGAGDLTLVWNGSNVQFILGRDRLSPSWVWSAEREPTLLAVRQMGPETIGEDQLDPYGRQLLLYFSEPVTLDDAFTQSFSIENNYLTRAENLRGRVVQVWARNPLGMRDRDLVMSEGVRSLHGVPLAPITHAIHMSDYWNATTLEGRVFGPDGLPAGGAVVSLVHGLVKNINRQRVNFLGFDELENQQFGDFAMDLRATLQANLEEMERNVGGFHTMPIDFVTATNEDGYYEMDMWPFWQGHTKNPGAYRGCRSIYDNGPCYLWSPNLRWVVSYQNRRTERLIYGRYHNQRLIHDFVFPALGSINVTIPPLPDGAEPQAGHLVKIQVVDLDERFTNRVMKPGETLRFDNLRMGPISILAQGVGGFDARSVTLDPETDGQVVTLAPAVEMATIHAQLAEINAEGVEVPLERGALYIYHYGAQFGGSVNGKLIAGATLGGEDTEGGLVTAQVPEGLVSLVYVQARQANIHWQTFEVVAGQTHDAGKFLLSTRERGNVNVLVTDELGNPRADWPVLVVDGLGGSIQNTDENGQTRFTNVLAGVGYAKTVYGSRGSIKREFTLSEDQPETSVHFEIRSNFSLTITVLDADGQIMPETYVKAGFIKERSAYTDDQGRVTFQWGADGPEFGDTFTLTAKDPRTFRTTRFRYIRPIPTDPDDPTTYVLDDAVDISFPAVGSAGLKVFASDTLLPLADVWVELVDADGAKFADTTNALGEVQFAGLSPGRAGIKMLPAVSQAADYAVSQGEVTIFSGQHAQQDLLLERVTPPDEATKLVNINGEVRDAALMLQSGVRVDLKVFDPNQCETVGGRLVCATYEGLVYSGDDGKYQVQIEVPASSQWLNISVTARDPDSGAFGWSRISWDAKTQDAYVPVTINTRADLRLRVWDQLGNRQRYGSITITQKNPATEEVYEQILNLSDEDFEPVVQVWSGFCVDMVYLGNGTRARLNTVVYPNESGRPVDIVVAPDGDLNIHITDAEGETLTSGVFLQVFKDGRLWTERYHQPEPGADFMTFADLPYGSWSVLAFDIASGVTDVWYGDIRDQVNDVTLTIRPGEAFRATVRNDTGTAVPYAQIILTRGSGALAFSSTQLDGVSRQQLLTRADENGYFTFPALPRGSYNIRIYDPATNRRKSVNFDLPETNDLDIVLRPVGYVHLSGILENEAAAIGARITAFRNGKAAFTGIMDGVSGQWTSPPIATGAVTFLVTSLDGNQTALINTEVLSTQTIDEEARLRYIPHTPNLNFVWDDGEVVGERIVVNWEWEAPGGLARLEGKTIFPEGSPIQHRFMEGTVKIRAAFGETLEHRAFSKTDRVTINSSDDLTCTVTRPRSLRVRLLDQFSGEPVAGARVRGYGMSATTDADGYALFRNVTIGATVTVNAVSGDGFRFGSGSVSITDDAVTELNVAMNSRVGDVSFVVTQLGETYSTGFIEMTGNGGVFSRVLDGTNQADFHFLLEGEYSWTYLDPVRGVRDHGRFVVEAGRTTPVDIEVPGGGPLTFYGEYAGGLQLPLGQIFEIRTDIKVFPVEIQEDAEGQRFAHWPALPEGTWTLRSPSIPTRDWQVRLDVEHGINNIYHALDSHGSAIPFWNRAHILFRDYYGEPVSRFEVRVGKPGEYTRKVGSFTAGLATINLKSGVWNVEMKPENSPLSSVVTVNVTEQNQLLELEAALEEEHATVRFPVTDSKLGFIHGWINGYADDGTGRFYTFTRRSFNAWVTLDYMPVGRTVRVELQRGERSYSPRSTHELMFQAGYQELNSLNLESSAPDGEFSVIWNDGLPTFVIEADRDSQWIDTIRLGTLYFNYDPNLDAWTYAVTDFFESNVWAIGESSLNIAFKGIHGASANRRHNFTWPSQANVNFTLPNPVTSLPQTLTFDVDDPTFQIDPNRLDSQPGSRLWINGRYAPLTLDEVDPTLVTNVQQEFDWPLRRGENTIKLLLVDINGRVAGFQSSFDLELPDLGHVEFPSFPDEFAAVITAQSPQGVRTQYTTTPGELFTLHDLEYGTWLFKWTYDDRVAYTSTVVNSPMTRVLGRSAEVDTLNFQITLMNEFGERLSGVPITVRQETGTSCCNSVNQYWDLEPQLTDSDGVVVVNDVSRVLLEVVADFGDYQIRQRYSRLGNPYPVGALRFNEEVILIDNGAGNVTLRLRDQLTEGMPAIADLDVYLDGEWVGETDENGEWTSQLYNAGRTLNFRVEGQTSEGGVVLAERAVVTVRDGILEEWLVQPDYIGSLNLSLSDGFQGFAGRITVGDHDLTYPFAASQLLELPEGFHTLTVYSRLDQVWFTAEVDITRNRITDLELSGPGQDSFAATEIVILDQSGAPAAGARIFADGVPMGAADAEGVFRANLYPATYHLLFTHAGGVGRGELTVAAGETPNAVFQVGGFSPLSIQGAQLWMMGEENVVRRDENGQAVGWLDLTGRGNHAQQHDPDARPTLVSDAVGQHGAMTFDGASQFLDLADGFEDYAFGLTAFVIVKPNANNYHSRILELGNGQIDHNIYLGNRGTGDTLIYGHINGSYSSRRKEAGVTGASVPHRFSMVEVNHLSGFLTIRRNGETLTELTMDIPTKIRRTQNYIGRGTEEDGRLFEGEIAEIILFNRFLPDDQRLEVETYLADKYQIYHPQAQWLNEFSGEVAEIIHIDQLSREEALRYQDFLAQNHPIPAAGLALWLDPETGLERDPQGRVIAWNDKSIYGFRGQAVHYPGTSNLGLSGRTYLEMGDEKSYFSFPNFGPELTNGHTIFLVFRPDASRGLLQSKSSADGRLLSASVSSSGNLYLPGLSVSSPDSLLERWTVISLNNREGETLTGRIQGETVSTQNLPYNYPNSGHAKFELGRYSNSTSISGYFDGGLAEVLIYKRGLTDQQALQVEAYLGLKYNLDVPLPRPFFEPEGGVYTGARQVTITNPIGQGVIRYTVDGTEPTESSPVYSGPLNVSDFTTIKAAVFLDGHPRGQVSAATYVIGAVGSGVVVLDEDKTIWAAGSTEQNYENKDVYITGASVEIVDTHNFANLYLINGAVLRHRSGELPGVHINVSGNVYIDNLSKIDADALAPISQVGQGAGDGGRYAAGAGHGGRGGMGTSYPEGEDVPGGATYGDPLAPNHFGSRGGLGRTYQYSYGGVGGGIIRLFIGGDLTVDGVISANGAAGIRSGSRKGGGGSGGSIHLTAARLFGNGLIEANGGYHDVITTPGFDDYSGGGGGRIALEGTPVNLNLDHIRAFNGLGGGAERGTVYLNGVPVAPALDDRDSDRDGLTDLDELNVYLTNPFDADADDDGLDDGQEIALNTDPFSTDSDQDGLDDGPEVNRWGTNPLLSDTDGDTLIDGDEVNAYGTHPILADTDADGLTDPVEINQSLTDPNDPDSDDDGLTDGEEVNIWGSNPLAIDTDLGGQLDGVEVHIHGTHPTNPYDDVTPHQRVGVFAEDTSSDDGVPVVDRDGNLHLIWTDNVPGEYEIFYKMLSSTGETLIDTTRISGDLTQSSLPHAAVDQRGRVHVVWDDYRGNFQREVYYTMLDPGTHARDGSPALPEEITVVDDMLISDPTTADSAQAHIAVDSLDRVHVVWAELGYYNIGLHYTRLAEGEVVVAHRELVPLLEDDSGLYPQLGLDSNDNINLVWYDIDRSNGYKKDVYYALFDGQSMDPLIDKTRISPRDGYDSYLAAMVVGSDDQVTVVYQDGRDAAYNSVEVYALRFDPALVAWTGGEADIAQMITMDDHLITQADGEGAGHAGLALDEAGNMIIGWQAGVKRYSYTSATTVQVFDPNGDPLTQAQALTARTSATSTHGRTPVRLAAFQETAYVTWTDKLSGKPKVLLRLLPYDGGGFGIDPVTVTPPSGAYDLGQTVTFSHPEPGAVIHYTLDGAVPTGDDPALTSGQSISLSQSAVVRARAVVPGRGESAVAHADYHVSGHGPNTRVITDSGVLSGEMANADLIIFGAHVELTGSHSLTGLTLTHGATLTHAANQLPGLALTVTGDVHIAKGSKIDVTGKGYPGATSIDDDGAGPGAGFGEPHAPRGGSHGGYSDGIPPYDDPLAPADFGSGGGWYEYGDFPGGAGGGRVSFNVSGVLQLDGLIIADGVRGGRGGYAGAGAGGSVHLIADSLTGVGHISADGRDGVYFQPASYGHAASAGGRVALESNVDGLDASQVSVHNGLGRAESGTLTINGVLTPTYATITFFVNDVAPGDEGDGDVPQGKRKMGGGYLVEVTYREELPGGGGEGEGEGEGGGYAEPVTLVQQTDAGNYAVFKEIPQYVNLFIRYSVDGGESWIEIEDQSVDRTRYEWEIRAVPQVVYMELYGPLSDAGVEIQILVDGSEPTITDAGSYYDEVTFIFNVPKCDELVHVELRFPGFSSPIVDDDFYIYCDEYESYLDISQSLTWPEFDMTPYTEEGAPLDAETQTTVLRAFWVDQITGEELQIRNGLPYWYNERAGYGSEWSIPMWLPDDGSVSVRYVYGIGENICGDSPDPCYAAYGVGEASPDPESGLIRALLTLTDEDPGGDTPLPDQGGGGGEGGEGGGGGGGGGEGGGGGGGGEGGKRAQTEMSPKDSR